MTRFIVIGAGAVGSVLAARLHEASVPHLLVGRGENIQRIREDGLRYIVNGRERIVPVNAADAAEDIELTAEDLLVFTTKTQDLEDAAGQWAWRAVGDSTASAELTVVSVQNGLDADRILLRRFRNVIGGSLLTPAQHLKPGVVRSGARGPSGVLTLGPVGEPGVPLPLIEDVAEVLRRIGYLVEVSEAVARWKAAKILFSVRNGLEVLSDENGQAGRVGELLAEEARRVLSAAGYVPAQPAERTIDVSSFAQDPDSGLKPGQQSTWQSVARGVSNEADFLNGEIVLLGRLNGIPAPLNEALQQLLGRAWHAGEEPGAHSIEELIALAGGIGAPA